MGLCEIIKLSNYYGSNTDYVIAGGGNTSYKDNEFLYIKGSGTTLATITESGFVKMNRAKLQSIWDKNYSDDTDIREAEVLEDLMNSREQGELQKRPSVETALHDLFSQTYVVHTHPAMVNGLTCSKNGYNDAKKLFGDNVIWIEPVMPGYVLAKTAKDKIELYEKQTGKKANMIFLENHGVFVAADTPSEIEEMMEIIMNTLNSSIKEIPDFSQASTSDKTDKYLQEIKNAMGNEVIFFNNKQIQSVTSNKQVFADVDSAFTPDHMVYYKRTPLYIQDGDDVSKSIEDFNTKYGFMPRVIAVQNVGVFALGANESQARIVESLFLDTIKIATYAKSFGGGKYMPDWLIDFIENWEVESYRSKVSQ